MNRLKTAILSVYDKRGIVNLANYLLNNNFQILSSGGIQNTKRINK